MLEHVPSNGYILDLDDSKNELGMPQRGATTKFKNTTHLNGEQERLLRVFHGICKHHQAIQIGWRCFSI